MIKSYLNEKVKDGEFMGAPRFKELDWQYDEKILFDENNIFNYDFYKKNAINGGAYVKAVELL